MKQTLSIRMTSICPECKSVIKPVDLVNCGGFCKRKFHRKCVSRVGAKWLCSDCYIPRTMDPDSEQRKRWKDDIISPSISEEISPDIEELNYVVTSTDNISRKLEEITKEMGRLSSTLNILKGENFRLKEDNKTLKLAINQICVGPCDPDCNAPCSKREDPCRVREDPCRVREDPCRVREDPCRVKEDSCRVREERTKLLSDELHSLVPESCHTRLQEEVTHFPRKSCHNGLQEEIYLPPKSCNNRQQEENTCLPPREKRKVMQTDTNCTYSEPIECEMDQLQIMCVDLCVEQNGSSHQTGMFDLMITCEAPQLVVRRGQPFILELTFNRPYNKESDTISFIFIQKMDETPSIGHKTLVILPLKHNEDKSEKLWGAVFDKSDGNSITVFITSAVDAIVGKWTMEIDSMVKNQRPSCYKPKDPIYILFNPWCKDDAVFLDNAEHRKEYVLTEVGMIWKGSLKQPQCSIWKYGQFDKYILECSLLITEKMSKLPVTQHNDPIMVAKAVVSAVNNKDNNGVVFGNWSGDYCGGKSPVEWIGSPKILRKFYQSQKPVKYGHCSVMAGVATTIFRALGIPSRTVTCYKVAHDQGCSDAIDIYIDDEGEFTNQFSKDMIWMFHVWSEIWTKRGDLGAEYDGWQVVDGTSPVSDRIFHSHGPAPVVAVKNEELQKPYEVAYVYSEINAAILYWKFQGPNKPLKLIQTDTTDTGQLIVTKGVGCSEREDLTNLYKSNEEENKEGRLVMLKALQSGDFFNRYCLNRKCNDITFEIQLPDNMCIGNTYSISLISRNVSEINHTVKIILRCAVQLYNGVILNIIKREQKRLAVTAECEEKANILLKYEDYSPYIKDDYIFHISALCKVENVGYEYYAQDHFIIDLPSIVIKLKDHAVVNHYLYGSACFKNPLPEKLKNCIFLIEGPGLTRGLKYRIEDVPPDDIAKVNFKMIPRYYGKQTIIAKFNSCNLNNIEGCLTIDVDQEDENECNNI